MTQKKTGLFSTFDKIMLGFSPILCHGIMFQVITFNVLIILFPKPIYIMELRIYF